MSFAPGGLSTWDYASDMFAGPFGEQAKPFDPSNFPCPPQSLLDAQESANRVGFSLPARPGYAPVIAPPPALQNLEPAWDGCKSQFAFDPPRSIVPASALVPSPTPTDQGAPYLTPAMPSPPTENLPAQTQLSNGPTSVKPFSSGDYTLDPPYTVDAPNNKEPIPNSQQGNSPESKTPESPVTTYPLNDDTSDANGKESSIPDSKTPGLSNTVDQPNNKQSTTNGRQGSILKSDSPVADQPPPSQAGQDDPEDPKASRLLNSDSDSILEPIPTPSVLEIGHQTFTALSSGGFAVAGTTLHADGPAITVQGTPVSLDTFKLLVGSSTLLLPTGSTNGVLIAAGQIFTPLSAGGIIVDGNTLSSNGPPIIVSGNVLSLAQSRFIVGTQTFAFPTPAPDRTSNVNRIITFEGQPITQFGNGAVAFHGLTLVPDGPAATISNTVVSLAPSKLVIGSQTLSLPTPAPDTFLPSAVIIDQTKLFAGGPAVTISGNTISLVPGNSGSFFLTGHRSDDSAFSVPVTAGESASVDAKGYLVIDDGSHGIGGLASAIMRGFGPTTSQALTASAGTSNVFGTPSENDSSNVIASVLGFTGGGSRCLELRIAAVIGLAIYLSIFNS